MERSSVSKRASLPNTSFPLKPQLKDPSFSTYRQPEQPISFQVIDETEISIFDAERYFNEGEGQDQIKDTKKCSPMSRTAERNDEQSTPRYSSESSADRYGRNYRSSSFHATPTASSEASWNSQTGLLSNPPGSLAVSMRNLNLEGKKKGSSGKWFFGKRCPCYGKKAVQVQDKFSESKTSSHMIMNGSSNISLNSRQTGEISTPKARYEGTKEVEQGVGNDGTEKMRFGSGNCVNEEEVVNNLGRVMPENHFPTDLARLILPSGGGFSFPILNPPTTRKLVLDAVKPMNTLDDSLDPPRESLEVFRPSGESLIQRRSTERRALMPFHSDGNQLRSFSFPMSPKMVEDDIMSDASSDLFEIESFSTQSTLYPMYRRRDSLDETSNYDGRTYAGNSQGNLYFHRSLDDTVATPSIAPTEGYEPSEVSIDWSVTTAEGFDRGSVTNFSISASEFEPIGPTRLEPRTANNGIIAAGSKRRGNGLLSCRCEKAVSIGPHPVKYVPDQPRFGTQVPTESGRFQATSRLSDISSMHITRASGNLQQSHSARMSRALTTH